MEIPGYTISKELGAGGMATVYLAVQENLHREVALKIMTPGLAVDETYCERFLKEGRITAQLSNSNLLTVYDIGVHENHYYMATEYLPGGTARQKMNAGITVEEVVRVIIDIGRGLQFAHGKGFVHRDVKPGNFMFRANGDAVLGDFGIAKAVDSNTGSTKLGTSIGTPHYMSPEQAKGEKVDHRSDLYSLGVVFFEMLTGNPPFDADDPFSVALMQISEPTPALPKEHKKFDPLIQRMMAKDRNERYNQADEFIADLKAVMAGGKSKPKRKAAKPPASQRAEDPSMETERSSELRAQGKSNLTRMLMYGSIVVLLAAASYIGWTRFVGPDRVEPVGSGSQIIVEDPAADPGQSADWIASQLELAEGMIVAGRLLQPAGNNALEVYRALLESNPGNQVILNARRELAKKLEQDAEVAWVTGEPDQAIEMLNIAIAEFPVEQSLRRLLLQIQQGQSDEPVVDTVTEEPIPESDPATTGGVNKGRVDQLLARGDRFFDANIFSHPPGENATDVYLQVLAVQPDNQHASDRLDKIAGTWANAAATNIKRGKLRIAIRMVDKGLQASPKNEQLLSLKQQIDEQQN